MPNHKLNLSEMIAKDIPLETAPWNETGHVVDLFFAAFQEDPFFQYLSLAARHSEEAIRQNFQFDINRAQINGVIFRTSHAYEAAAVWHLNGFPKSNFLLNLRMMWFKLNQFRVRDIRKLVPFFFEIDKAHTHFVKRPHYYLSLFGVHPKHHGKGWGSKLIRPVLDHADKNKKICYLETETEKNVAMYQHYGFEMVKTLQPDFCEDNFYLMLRRPLQVNK
ncbi:MAG: GNAT family N-acetyltransferase [Pelolinea sp.]|nr:GNAT family N-acetyltransferase [Pelolinea sp.]